MYVSMWVNFQFIELLTQLKIYTTTTTPPPPLDVFDTLYVHNTKSKDDHKNLDNSKNEDDHKNQDYPKNKNSFKN